MSISFIKYLNPYIINSNFWQNNTRYKILFGGRASSKSHEFATMIIILASIKPLKILCTRAFQNRIKDSVKALLEEKIELLDLQEYFDIKERAITSSIGSEFLFYGLARNTGEIKSLEGVDICYIEEGQYITKDMWNILTPTIRKENSQIWISFNPLLETDFIYKLTMSLHDKPNASVLKINYINNPYLSKTMLEEIELKKNDVDFNNIYLGEPRRDLENSVILYSNVIKNISNCKNIIKKDCILGIDIANGGKDTNAIAIIKNKKLIYLEEFKSDRGDFDKTVNIVLQLANEYRVKKIIYDSVGVGAGFGTILKNNKYNGNIVEFIAGAKTLSKNAIRQKIGNRDKFKNLKAQMWIYLSKLLQDEEFTICNRIKHIDKLKRELTTPQLIEFEGRKLGIEPKEKLLERGINSPNLADSVIIALFGDINSSW